MQNIEDRIDKAGRLASDLEPWPGYFLVRGLEMDYLLRSLGTPDFGDALDIGCGNGFTSYLLSDSAKSVTAADLYGKDPGTHSPGLESAHELLSRLGAPGIKVCSSSIEEMPFRNGSFDTVFSSYTLQYIKDRRKALGEIKRVVKKGGMVILMLPNFIERFYAVMQFYVYMLLKGSSLLWRAIFKDKAGISAGEDKISLKSGRFKENYKYFPFPGPHGAYRNSAVEMKRHIPASWNREFRDAGFTVESSFTTTFVPYPLVLTFSLKAALILSKLAGPFTKFFGTRPVARYLGYNYCVVLKNG